jgi:cytidine deaminase
MTADDVPFSRENLLKLASAASDNAVAPHSNFHVGAALEAEDGSIHTGCNVESDSYGLTICAERVALTKALSEGVRGFTRIAIVGKSADGLGPCGACRQLLWDHCRDIEVISGNTEGVVAKVWRLADLLPDPFTFEKR